MTKKKIIHLIQALDNGGCENMLLRTIPLLTDLEHIIITLKKRGDLADDFENKNIQVININQNNLLNAGAYKRLLKSINGNKPDLIITYLFHADAIGRIFIQLFSKYKVIPFLRTTYNHKKYWAARLFEKLTKYFVKNYLANSESVKNFYTKNIGVKSEKITVIPNGIDVDFYDKIPREINFRRSLDITDDEIAIICVANLHINKGHKYLLEAFEQLYSSPCFQGGELKKGLKLLLVGNGEEKEDLLKQIESYQSRNNILFLGKRNDVPRLLKISDIFVLPTLFEGMSNAIMEAMASGLPIIASNIPENRELIENSKDGFLVKVRNSDEIRNSLRNIIESHESRIIMGKSAKEKIRSQFEIKKIAQKFSAIIDHLIKT